MPLVSLKINNRSYEMACADGEEAHLQKLAAQLDQRIEDLRTQMLGAAEVKLLLAAALTLADELDSLRKGEPAVAAAPPPRARDKSIVPDPADKLAAAFEQLVTQRVDTIAAKLNAA